MNLKTQEDKLKELLNQLEIDIKEDATFVICGGLKDYTTKDGVSIKGLNTMKKNRCYEDGNIVIDKPTGTGEVIPKEVLFEKAYRDKEKTRIGNKLFTFEEAIKSVKSGFCSKIGLWIPRGYLVVDTDSKESSKIVGDYIKTKNLSNPVIKTKKGYHIFFKYDGDMTQMVAGKINLGCEVDYRVAEKGYIVLPYNDPEREIKQIGKVEYISHKLFPVEEDKKEIKKDTHAKTKNNQNNAPKKSHGGKRDGAGRKALFSPAVEGERDDKLFKQLVRLSKLREFRNFDSLLFAATAFNAQYPNPLDESQVLAKVHSALNYTLPDFYDHDGKIIPYLLAEMVTENNSIVSDRTETYIYKNNTYTEVYDDFYSILSEVIEDKRYFRMATVKEVAGHIRGLTSKGTPIENDRRVINFKNGLLDIESRTLISHSKDYVTLGQYNACYEENLSIKGTYFEKYLNTSLTEDTIKVVQEMLGLCLYPLTDKIHYFYILTGEGRNGKGILMDTIFNIVPTELRSGITIKDYDTRFKNHSIKGKTVNICMDDNTTRLEGVGEFKSATAGEPIFTEKKGVDGALIRSTLTHISSFNTLPTMQEKNDAMFDRMIVIPFENTFGTKQEVERGEKMFVGDPMLKHNIINNELDIVVSWAIQGLFRVIDNGYKLTKPDAVEKAKEVYRLDTDSVRDWCTKHLSAVEATSNKDYVKTRDLYKKYCDWCYIEGITPVQNKGFRAGLERLYKKYRKEIHNYVCFSVIYQDVKDDFFEAAIEKDDEIYF